MSPTRQSWSSDRVKSELEDALENLRRLDEHLAEPLTLNDSIVELETTIAFYDHLAEMEADDA
ncbi:hypothetical protein [Saliphagus infecundisoli]|uniref:Uncharacterized protein n=1 Tax=Saliphagus infecundisoli TaxID=1849069 RepID=A0ABD5QB92_9EURY|nr:hypothetical protein [Saliphagus infecundisoli]